MADVRSVLQYCRDPYLDRRAGLMRTVGSSRIPAAGHAAHPGLTPEGQQLAEQMPAWLDRLRFFGKAARRE